MPRGLKRYQVAGDVHLVTFSCDGRRPYLDELDAYQTFELVFERMRRRHRLSVFGYVLMPEHVHLLVNEPPNTSLDVVPKVIKQESAKKLRKLGRKHFWEERYHDFNVFSEAKFKEKLRYIHRNPVKRGLATKPEQWNGAVSVITRTACRERLK